MKDCSTDKRYSRRYGPRSVWSLTIPVLLLMLAALLSACTGPSVNEEPNTVAQEKTAESATVDEILSDPNDFYGLRATVTGRVTEVITPLTFELNGGINEDSTSGPGPQGGYGEDADGLLVVKNTEQAPDPEVAVGQTVEVSGSVRSFDVEEIQEEIGEELTGSVLTYWASRPSIVATSIESTEGTTP
jgi:hypothetical protein